MQSFLNSVLTMFGNTTTLTLPWDGKPWLYKLFIMALCYSLFASGIFWTYAGIRIMREGAGCSVLMDAIVLPLRDMQASAITMTREMETYLLTMTRELQAYLLTMHEKTLLIRAHGNCESVLQHQDDPTLRTRCRQLLLAVNPSPLDQTDSL
jgi:hypothetical protein